MSRPHNDGEMSGKLLQREGLLTPHVAIKQSDGGRGSAAGFELRNNPSPLAPPLYLSKSHFHWD